jgi:thiamine biosynthesis protein ThiS
VQITLNGEARSITEGTTVLSLLASLGLERRRVAVEVNRQIVGRDAYAEHAIHPGDQVEIVQFVGGG